LPAPRGSFILGGMMKPLIAALVSLSFAAPAFACPEHDEAPRTAEKKAPEEKQTTTAQKKDAKPAPKADAKDAKGDKVSQK
jgi:hypothetical protein